MGRGVESNKARYARGVHISETAVHRCRAVESYAACDPLPLLAGGGAQMDGIGVWVGLYACVKRFLGTRKLKSLEAGATTKKNKVPSPIPSRMLCRKVILVQITTFVLKR